MELPGSAYLFTLATISITYAGFGALSIILRQIVGGRINDFDVFYVSSVVVRGFLLASCSLLPMLLAPLQISNSSIWRLCSFITAVAQAVFLLVWYVQRRAVASAPLSNWSLASYVGQWCAAIFLVAISLNGIFLEATVGNFAAGLTALLLLGFVQYFIALRVSLKIDSKKEGPTNARTRRRNSV
jgi:hypothetical protein